MAVGHQVARAARFPRPVITDHAIDVVQDLT
jgi:hypothetical protein